VRGDVGGGGLMARWMQLAIDCADPDRLAAFWAEALGYRLRRPPSGHDSWAAYSASVAEEPGEAWCMLVDPDGAGPPVLFHKVPEAKVVKNRMHLDLRVDPNATVDEARPLVDAETRRLVALGATHVRTDDDGHDYYAVMQDPEGNEFCVG
jgi:catechol 2,3-dioxygenase-like lactoylglutathione lyase family enzyme